ncbi:MAG TPA: iron-sulfur cluster assembly protein [Acidimicrobiales bacterium]|nr:iron-sulfur cluster assembly protein [Acidimicrobiales bacterium]
MSEGADAMSQAGGPLDIGPTRARLAPAGPVEAAWEALRCVYDPELCLDVVSLGLVYDVREERGNVVVEMTLTTPGCPVSESLPVEAREAVRQAVDVRLGVEVEVVWDPPWNPAMMDDEAASALGFRIGS